ncbi:MAG: FAD-dependent oxidoreductase [Acidobacteria bacterium]|nr:FAD-dependent oxidoreductase [Acidobacteriota bacterium]MCA1639404.1 FAD-dependent oxidoreductase [Acidobacteriota bacterium]
MTKSDEGKTVSYWEATGDLLDKTVLDNSIETDVCIIGGGIAGLTTAYLLAKEGKKVIVIDDGPIGGGETCRTTAHLSNAIDDRIYRIEEWHGEEKARLAVDAHTRAIGEIERIVETEKIDCNFLRVDGFLIEAEDGEDDLNEELEAAHRAGFAEVEFVERAPVKDFNTGKCLCFPRQGQFHILKYLSGLTKAIEQNGGKLFSNTRAIEWKDEDAPEVKTATGQTIRAKSIVLATNYPIMSKMFAKLPAYRTYVIGVKIPKNSVERCLIWDTADPYRYVRTQPENDFDVLIVGGEDHRTGQDDNSNEHFGKLVQWTQKRFPFAEEILYKWSGQFLETHDGLAFIGRFSSSEPNVYLITGDSGMGMTHGTIGGMLVSDLILERTNPWTEVFEPSRILTQSITEAVPEIISSTVPYVDWLTGGDVSSIDEIKRGEGAIVSHGTTKIAAYRDESGKIYQRSAVCVHLGCIVRFNSLEKTWDCPCHGSRYGIDGHPINTPAFTALAELKSEEND